MSLRHNTFTGRNQFSESEQLRSSPCVEVTLLIPIHTFYRDCFDSSSVLSTMPIKYNPVSID